MRRWYHAILACVTYLFETEEHAQIRSAARKFAPDGLDCVLLTAGGAEAEKSLKALRDGGRVAYPNGVEPAPKARPGIKVKSYDGTPKADTIPNLNRLIEAAPFEVHVARTFPLDKAAEAIRALSSFDGPALAKELLENYAWYQKNAGQSIHPVGMKMPNDLGIFDAYGNVWTWCQEASKDYPNAKGNAISEDVEDYLEIVNTRSRALRGGSFYNQPSNLRSAYRDDDVPTYRINRVSFRLARTLVP